MAVPASFNDLVVDAAQRNFHGDIWYQRVARVPRGWDGSRISIYFMRALASLGGSAALVQPAVVSIRHER